MTYKNDRPNIGGEGTCSSSPSSKHYRIFSPFSKCSFRMGTAKYPPCSKTTSKNAQSNIQMLLKEFPALSSLELHQCTTIKSQLSYESVQTGVTIKYQPFKDRESHLLFNSHHHELSFCLLFISRPEEATPLVS